MIRTCDQLRDDLFCRYCGKQCKSLNSLKQHEIRCKSNPYRLDITGDKAPFYNKTPWNKGLTKETDKRLLKASNTYKSNESLGLHQTHSHPHTDETKQRLSVNAMNNNFQSHWGTRKSFEYNGVKFQSSYEVEVAKSLDENNVVWVKPQYGIFKYKDMSNKVHTYTPDFYLPEYNIYLDPKNDFLIENINPSLGFSDKQKINWVEKQNNVRIIILNKNQLKWDYIKTII